MSTIDVDPDVSELDALKGLIESDGWQVFTKAVREQWGAEACLRHIDKALGELPSGDVPAQHDTVAQIRAAALAVERILGLPALRIEQLTKQKPVSTDRLSRWRRA